MKMILPDTTVPDAARAACEEEALTAELRMLCRGLAYSSFATLSAVRTSVHLPDDEASERALCTICGDLARGFGVEFTVRRASENWAVCFYRHVAEERAATAAEPADGERRGLFHARLVLARDRLLFASPRRLNGCVTREGQR